MAICSLHHWVRTLPIRIRTGRILRLERIGGRPALRHVEVLSWGSDSRVWGLFIGIVEANRVVLELSVWESRINSWCC